MRVWVWLVLAVTVAPPAALGALAAANATGAISGVVRIDGKPAARVRVVLLSQVNRAAVARGATDDEGRYTLRSVPAGSYLVRAHAPAYVVVGGASTDAGDGTAVTLADGESLKDVNVDLVPGGVIAGRVTTPEGEPVVGEQVRLSRLDGEPHGLGGLDWQTDDRGAYRIYGLAPGRYLIAAGEPDDVGTRYSSFRETYYPGGADAARAEPVEVRAGVVAKGIDIVLGVATPAYNASGRARFADTGVPVAGASVTLLTVVDGQVRGTSHLGISTDARGEFHVEGLAPGTYRIKLQLGVGGRHFAEPVAFSVADRDVTGLEVRFVKGASISGVVYLDGSADPAVRARLAELVIAATRVTRPDRDGGLEFDQVARANVGADGAFTLGGLAPGSYWIDVSHRGIDRAFYLWGVERDGVPTDHEVELRPNEDIANLRVAVRCGTATLKGTVKVRGARGPNVALSVQVRRAGRSYTFVLTAPVDDRGHFLVERVPPGELEVDTILEVRDGSNAARQSVGRPVPVTVADGATVETELTVDLPGGEGEGK